MEDRLIEATAFPVQEGHNCLNPCFNGRQTDSVKDLQSLIDAASKS